MTDLRQKRLAVILFAMLMSLGIAKSQSTSGAGKNDVIVSDAWVSRQSHTLVIDYSIDLGENVISCDVDLLMSVDGGSTFEKVKISDKLTGDIGRVTVSGSKRIVYDVGDMRNQLAGKEIAFKVKVSKKHNARDDKGKVFVMGTASSLKMFGLRAGYVKRFGGYVSYNDTFTDDWNVTDFGMLTNSSITGGLLMKANSWLYPYVGTGVGFLSFYDSYQNDYFETFGDYPKDYHYDDTHTFIPFEIGSVFGIGHFMLSVAIEPVIVMDKGFLFSFELGVGFSF